VRVCNMEACVWKCVCGVCVYVRKCVCVGMCMEACV